MNGKIEKTSERGSTTIIALLVLFLLLVFVALAVSRTTNETLATANDASETRAFTAAEASLENMTQQFDAIFDFQLSPTTTDLTNIQNSAPPNFTDYNFTNTVEQTDASKQIVISGGLLQGLYATRDSWRLTTTTRDSNNGVEVMLRRTFFNDRIPIFQFGIFYNDDLEFHPGPRFDFGGRVHSNGNLFLAASTGLYFSSRVTAHGEILTDVARNGHDAKSTWGDNVFIRDSFGTYKQLTSTMGSALKTGGTGGTVFTNPPNPDAADMPFAARNPNWNTNANLFGGNLLALQKDLQLPLRLAGQKQIDYIELIKRGKNLGDVWNDGSGTAANPAIVGVAADKVDNQIVAISRYANKSGLRISLADNKEKLPGCATNTGTAVAGQCGIRLDGAPNGLGGEPTGGAIRGYQPRQMVGGYQATQLNGDRFVPRDSNGNAIANRQVWIKIEEVWINQATNQPQTIDVTEDILSLGVTEAAPWIKVSGTDKFKITTPNNYYTFNSNEGLDTRSIVRLQRFEMDGMAVGNPSGGQDYLTPGTWNSIIYNFIKKECPSTKTNCNVDEATVGNATFPNEIRYRATIEDTTKNRWVSPFPIKMFDTREGLYNEDINPDTVYGANNVTDNGVMSLVEIDVNNLRRFLNGDFNSNMPTGTLAANSYGRAMRGSDVPDSNGWVLYISDRRGDRDFDGEYDMEDVYGNNDGILQPGEDVNKDKVLNVDYKGSGTTNPNGEAPKYNEIEPADRAAVLDHSYYRRGVRLVNGGTLPGTYIAGSYNTNGFTVASENAVYVQGNYNATGVASYGSPTPADDYLPHDSPSHIPASIIADAVVILSNSWRDARSFASPWNYNNRVASETFDRFAIIAGDAKSSYDNTPNQGGGDPRLAGGVHNFKRFLENWGNVRLNYAGSLINMYNSRNNNGTFKCCSRVYSPPIRNWTFDTSFLEPTRLPPGTPFFQVIQLTGFQRINS